jgi:hypothetical protein
VTARGHSPHVGGKCVRCSERDGLARNEDQASRGNCGRLAKQGPRVLGVVHNRSFAWVLLALVVIEGVALYRLRSEGYGPRWMIVASMILAIAIVAIVVSTLA